MKKQVALCIVVLVFLCITTGCDENKASTSDLVLRFTCDKFIQSQRSLIPEKEHMVITSYHIQGTGPQDGTVDIEAMDSCVTLGNLAIGTWNLTAQAMNAKGAVLAQGNLTTLLSPVTSSATMNLTQLVGEGSLSVGFSWDIEQVADDVRLDISITDQENNQVSCSSMILDKMLGTARLNAELAAGSYCLNAKLYSQGSVVSGATEAVRIIEDTTTSGSITMYIGDRSSEFSLTVINDTMLPISGSILCSPESPSSKESVTLTFTPDNLPQDISMESLTSTWYCEGEIVHSGYTYTSVPAAGSHRYDIIMSHQKLGSIGSATILVNMPL
ncbi:MAG: hypothetical protein WC136_08005 [Sphaerochaeta sp.]|nr:hypothetical protein [Sphaerochaeta sp.]